jgi:transposase
MASCMVMCGAHALRGLSWPLPEGMDDEGLELLLFPAPTAASQSDRRPVPDWVYVEKELRRRSVTRLLLWEEYRAANPLEQNLIRLVHILRRRSSLHILEG